jgi:very-short-patch-repair endonuclease
LIVELDGGQHAQRADYDAERTTYLQARGYRVLRIWNDELLRTPDAILEGVWRALKTPSPVER